MSTFEVYKPRKVEFEQLLKVGDWRVKVYTITNRGAFKSRKVLENALANLPKWLARSKKFGFPTYGAAFLIVHEGRDGVWSLINWWIGGEMLRSLTFYTTDDDPNEFKITPKEGGMACVWEMAVISYERAMWVEYILRRADNPDFEGYLQNYICGEV